MNRFFETMIAAVVSILNSDDVFYADVLMATLDWGAGSFRKHIDTTRKDYTADEVREILVAADPEIGACPDWYDATQDEFRALVERHVAEGSSYPAEFDTVFMG